MSAKPKRPLPPGWEWVRLGDLLTERNERGFPDLPLLAITADRGVIHRDELEKRDTSNPDKSKYLRIMPGDIGYNTMRMWQGVAGLSKHEGIVSPAYTICTPTERIYPPFAAYLLKADFMVAEFRRWSQGLVDDTLSLKYHRFAQIYAPLPPLPVQRWIADALGSVDEWTRTVAQLQKADNVLGNLLIVDIFKNSRGIESKVPIVSIESGRSLNSEKREPSSNDVCILKTSCTNLGEFDYSQRKPIDPNEVSKAICSLEANSIIMSRMNTPKLVGDSCYCEIEDPKTFLPDRLWKLKTDENICDTRWFAYYLTYLRMIGRIEEIATGTSSSMKNISKSQIMNLKVVLPPISSQKKDAQLLNSVGEAVKSSKQALEASGNIRQLLLHQLLSGELQPQGGWAAVIPEGREEVAS